MMTCSREVMAEKSRNTTVLSAIDEIGAAAFVPVTVVVRVVVVVDCTIVAVVVGVVVLSCNVTVVVRVVVVVSFSAENKPYLTIIFSSNNCDSLPGKL